jgi:hypothetical protein
LQHFPKKHTSRGDNICFSLFTKATRFRSWCGYTFCNKILGHSDVIAGALITSHWIRKAIAFSTLLLMVLLGLWIVI